jgi:hypothetical protein
LLDTLPGQQVIACLPTDHKSMVEASVIVDNLFEAPPGNRPLTSPHLVAEATSEGDDLAQVGEWAAIQERSILDTVSAGREDGAMVIGHPRANHGWPQGLEAAVPVALLDIVGLFHETDERLATPKTELVDFTGLEPHERVEGKGGVWLMLGVNLRQLLEVGPPQLGLVFV